MYNTFPALIDSYMDSGSPTTNYGTSTSVHAGWNSSGGVRTRSLLLFDLTSLPGFPGIVVSAATLTLNVNTVAGSGQTFQLTRCTQSWTESGVTWAIYDGINNWRAAGGDFSAAEGNPTFTGPAVPGEFVIQSSAGLINLINDALRYRSKLLNIGMYRTVEKITNHTIKCDSREGAHGPYLAISWTWPQTTSLARRRRS